MPSFDESLPIMETALLQNQGAVASSLFSAPEPSFLNLIEAFLNQHLDDRKTTQAIEALTKQGLDRPEPIAEADLDEIRQAWSQAGLKMNPKVAASVQKLAKWLVERWQGDLDSLAEASTETIRDELRQINGVGPATADWLLLKGLNKPAFPVDRASYRIFLRHGWIDITADYDEARSVLERLAPDDPAKLAHWSNWFEKIGKDHCKQTAPRCDRCPLRNVLPDHGPLEPE